MMHNSNNNREHYHHQQQSNKDFYELSSLLLSLLRSPPSPPINFDQNPISSSSRPGQDGGVSATSSRTSSYSSISPAGFASLMLGISLALMLCGSVTFFIGFMLMPWVLGLVMVFYFLGVVSYLTMLGRAIFCQSSSLSPSNSPRKDIPAWKLL